MTLSNIAHSILKNPTRMLHTEHSERQAIDPVLLYSVKAITSCDESSYCRALKEIREIASRRGSDPKKTPIHDSIYRYASDIVLNQKMVFKSFNSFNNHIKGLWGCEIPRKFRDEFQSYIRNGIPQESPVQESPVQETPVQESPVQEVVQSITDADCVSLNLEGLSFTLSKGASLTIGELSTKTLDFKGLKSITINKVEGGCLYGVNLET